MADDGIARRVYEDGEREYAEGLCKGRFDLVEVVPAPMRGAVDERWACPRHLCVALKFNGGRLWCQHCEADVPDAIKVVVEPATLRGAVEDDPRERAKWDAMSEDERWHMHTVVREDRAHWKLYADRLEHEADQRRGAVSSDQLADADAQTEAGEEADRGEQP